MRCAKCGYISFDHLDSCRKCHKPMADSGFKGTTSSVAVPQFLQPSEDMDVGELAEELVDILDPDLELLAGEDDEEIGFGADMVEDQGIAFKGTVQSTDGDDGEIALGDNFDITFDVERDESTLSLDEDDLFLDTSRFADVPVNVRAVEAVRPVQLKIPDDLADISDLSRPDLVADLNPDSGVEMKADFGADLDVDLDFADLDLVELDLPVVGQMADESDALAGADDFADLFLDDMDLSNDLETVPSQSSARPVENDLDIDLDIDLDLGALGSEKGEQQKKKSDDLSDLSLSLE
ncbi:MAG: hypothetical protein K0A99_07950 [Desulfoarculaceae bacterium]|nr:hypothetical protein [Desulfoarculaceae bacterium]